jgi:hypothetical protein
MNALRSLVRDLIDRKLWPVALLLVAVAVAIPVFLGRAPAPAPAPAPTAAPAPAAPPASEAQNAEVTLDPGVPTDRERGGAVHDPFKAPAAKKNADTSPSAAAPTSSGTPTVASGGTSSAAAPSTGSDSPASSGSQTTTPSHGATSGSSGSGASKPTAPKPTTAPKAEDASDTYHVSVRFGVNGGATKTVRDIARLSPLPSITDPFFVYLGVMETATTHEKRAVFLVSSDATPNGEGSCHPTKQDCETVELTKGQTVFFDYTPPGGAPIQYQLELAGIHKTAVASAAKAQAAIARHSGVGQELLRDAAVRNVRAAAGARAYRFVPATGLLVRAKRRHVTAKAAAAGAVPGIALLARKDQPGIPVWHSPKHER